MIALGTEDVLSKEAAIYRSEALLLVGVCGLELSVARHLIHVVVGQCEDGLSLWGALDVHAGSLQVCEELLVHQRLAGNHRDLTCAYGAPEVGVGLAAYEFGLLQEAENVVSHKTGNL